MVFGLLSGSTMYFINRDPVFHTVTIPRLGFDKRVKSRSFVSVDFAEAGTYGFGPTIHTIAMLGVAVVKDKARSRNPKDAPWDFRFTLTPR